jgi:IS4 transposase
LLDLEEGGGRLYVFDAGYFDIDRYHEITDTGNHFVTKLHGNIEPEPVCNRPVPSAYAGTGKTETEETDEGRTDCGYAVLSDRYVRLSDREMWYRVLKVKVSTDETIEILTNLLWLDAAQICRLYHHRWSIEIVFRWPKDRLQLDHFISRDPRGIVRQIVTALIVWGLLTIYNREEEGFKGDMARGAPSASAGDLRLWTSVSKAWRRSSRLTLHYWAITKYPVLFSSK